MKRSCTSLFSGLVFSAALLLSAPATTFAGPWQAQTPDNTGANKTDRNSQTPTADQGKNNLSDRDLMKHIRQDVVRDKSISTYGHNVKIIATNGKVVLRGPVHSEEEKKAIEEHARKYAGENVDDQLSVKGDSK